MTHPSGSSDQERAPAVAGLFYPASRESLHDAVVASLAQVRSPRGTRPIALLGPHAGYSYCGTILAEAWHQAVDHPYELIVLLGTNHFTPGFDRVAVWTGGPWRTPLGPAGVDTVAAADLIAADPTCCVADPWPHLDEHSIEVQLPFAQTVLPAAPILPILVGLQSLGSREYFGELLVDVLADRSALIFASSDLSHYPSRSDAESVDRATIEAILSLDSNRFEKGMADQMTSGIAQLATCACGEAPIMVVMAAAANLGCQGGSLLAYGNSGEAPSGDESRVVGYAAIVFTATEGGDSAFDGTSSRVLPG